MTTVITAIISGLCVAIPNIIATLSSNNKKETEKLLNDIRVSIKNETLGRCKVDLINAMSRIHNGYIPTEEERRILFEEKQEYNQLGGDSYVDDMFERLQKEGKI